MNANKEMDLKLIRYMIENQELSASTMNFLIKYLLDSIESDWNKNIEE